jgi:hypothetical protein
VVPRQHDDNTHDIGFVFYPSFALGYELTGEEEPGLLPWSGRSDASLSLQVLPRGGKEMGILVHSAYSVPHQDGIDSSVMWGEWVFLRAISHLVTGPVPIP